MFCTACGQQIRDESKYCSQCGQPAGSEVPPRTQRLVRVREGKKIAGVCAGFARYLGMDVRWLRIVWALTLLTAGVRLIAYVVAWIAMSYDDEAIYSQTDGNGNPVADR